MCKFNLHVVLCGCKDHDCKMREAQFNNEGHPHPGHVKSIHGCYRSGPMCIRYFDNDDPHRLLVRWGMRTSNANSTQDCLDATYNIAEFQVSPNVCDDCLSVCKQESKAVLSFLDLRDEDYPKSTRVRIYPKRETTTTSSAAKFPFLPGTVLLPPPGLGF